MSRVNLVRFACVITLAAGSATAATGGAVPFAELQSRAPDDLARLQVRVSYVGPESRSFPSIALSLPGDTLDSDLARTYGREPFKYPDASTRWVVCPITPLQLKTALDSLSTLPDVVDGGVDSLALFSFALVDTSGGEARWFESILDETSGTQLVTRLASALRDNPRAWSAMSALACGLRVQPPDLEGEVTRSLAVTLSHLSPDGTPRRITARLRVMNLSRDTIPGPLVVVVRTSPASVRLLGADGYTCRVFYPGCPYVVMPLERPLAPGAVVERDARFDNPRQESFTISRRVFVGLSDR